MREKDGFFGCGRVSGGYDFAGSGVLGCLGRVVSLETAVDQKGLTGGERLRDSG